MKLFFVVILFASVAIDGCGKPDPTRRCIRPDQINDFPTLFGKNCSGCHGVDGQFGPAPPLNDQLFQTIISDEQLTHIVVAGRTDTLMPAFAESHGGTLTDEQISILVKGIRQQWAKTLKHPIQDLPIYQIASDDPAGIRKADVAGGATVFEKVCSMCHGEQGSGGDAGAITGPAFGKLISDQLLRRTIITGRADLGMPDFVDNGSLSELNRPLEPQEIIDVAAYVRSIQRKNHGK